MFHRLVIYSHIYKARISFALNVSLAVGCFKQGIAISILDREIFDFYMGLPHVVSGSLVYRLSPNANMYHGESLVSFLRKYDVIKIGLN